MDIKISLKISTARSVRAIMHGVLSTIMDQVVFGKDSAYISPEFMSLRGSKPDIVKIQRCFFHLYAHSKAKKI
jgi:hypothetical protein